MRVDELTRLDLLKAATPEPWKTPMKERIKGYVIKFTGMSLDPSKNECVATFSTVAPGHTNQLVYIQLEDFWEMFNANQESERPLSVASLLNLVIMNGDIKIYCTCPSWIYGGYKYMASQLDYAFYDTELRFPKVRNPKLQGTLCKHAYIVLKALPYQKFGLMGAVNSFLKQNPHLLKGGINNARK